MNCILCKRNILDRYALYALGRHWHEECLKCVCCNRKLSELGATFYFRSAMTLCLNCYVRLYGQEGKCVSCEGVINALEWIMRVNGNVYHLKCFACHKCRGRFCVGEKFSIREGKIFCYDECPA